MIPYLATVDATLNAASAIFWSWGSFSFEKRTSELTRHACFQLL